MITIAFALTAITSLLLSLASPWSRAPLWKATVTPLASIIGSGFLVSAPLLVREFGGYAAPAMLLLILVAGMIGWTIRYNIRVVEPELARGGDRVLISLEEISHVVLSFAYFVSVAYYLSLLGHFVLEAAGVQNDALAHNIAIALVLGLGLLGWLGGAERIASLERYATALNLSVIAGFLVTLGVFAALHLAGGDSVLPPPGRFEASSLPVLLGLLIVVQGFETSRFMEAEFDSDTRIRAMRLAQYVSGIIYILFFLLLSPLFPQLAGGDGVAAIISVSALVAGALPLSITVAATASQLSASVADSVGNTGLIRDLSHGRIDARHSYALVAVIGVTILIASDVNEVIALASRAFALFYALQCLVAWEAARKRPGDRGKALIFAALAAVAVSVCLFGTPSE